MGPHRPTRAAYSWRPGFIHFLPIGRIQRRDTIGATIIESENALILVSDFNIHHPLWNIQERISRNNSEIAAYMLRWNMELYTLFSEIIRRKHKQRIFIINLAWAIIGLLIRYYKNISFKKSNHKAQFISIYITPGIMKLHTLKIKE
jgi:hypothetical protein